MSTFDPTDLDAIGAALSDEERLVQRTARAFVRDRVLPQVGRWFEDGIFPRELVRELGDLGALGMHLDGYGCAGAGPVSYGLVCFELEAGDSGLRSFVSVQGSLAMFAIHEYGDEQQRQAYLPLMARGELIGCFGLSEADAGSDPASMRTKARKAGKDWVLDGSKMWITNGSIADIAVVWAATDEGIRGFLVPRGTPGFSAVDIHRKLSLRASVTSELVFDSCRLPADAQLPGATGLKTALSCLDEGRYGIAWGALGAAASCYQAALSYSLQRKQFGRQVASFQLTQAKLADMAVELQKGLLLAYHLGRLKQAGRISAVQVSVGKLNNVREALEIARKARTILGAAGVTLEHPVIRHAANLESVLTYEGTSEVHQLVIGRALTGLNAFE